MSLFKNVHWSEFFRSEKNRIKMVRQSDVEAAPLPPTAAEKEEEINMLGLRMMSSVVKAAEISGRIKTTVTKQVALMAQGRA